MIDMEEPSPTNLLDQLADLDPQERREVAAIVRRLSENLAEVPDGKTTSQTPNAVRSTSKYGCKPVKASVGGQ